MFDFTAERVTASIDESLKRLGVEYIDSIQVHDPEFAPSLDIICNETLPALAKARDAGKVRAYSGSIGGMTGRFGGCRCHLRGRCLLVSARAPP